MNLSTNNLSKKNLITVVVPSLNQGNYLDKALSSIFEQNVSVEVFLMDGGSTDNSLKIINKWKNKLCFWRSHKDNGQASAINEGVALGSAPYICWLNSDDWFLPEGLVTLLNVLENNKNIDVAYGKTWEFKERNGKITSTWVEPFNEYRLALRCIISQPATLIRRSAWEFAKGLDDDLQMALDYDLWWRIYRNNGNIEFVDEYIAVNRDHRKTKTNKQRAKHYHEAIKVVKKHYGSVPLKWRLAQPYSVWFRSIWPF
jgi:glycosyltransferase involved in cell wall biosynthesis